MKRIISMVLSLIIVISALGVVANADEILSKNQIRMGENIIGTYSDDGKTLTVSGNGKMYQIERESGGYVYREKLPYKVNKSVEKIIIDGNITYISDYAFCDTNITEFSMPKSVKEIGAKTFADCEKLVKFDLGSNIEAIGYSAFNNCGITEIKLPKSLNVFGYTCDDAQDFCFNEYGTFSNCKNLKTIDIGECTAAAIANFGVDLSTCNNLTEIKVDKSNKTYSVKSGVLFNKNKTKLYIYNSNLNKKSYTLPKTVKSIGYASFFNQKNLKNIKFNKKIKSIKKLAFSGLKIKSFSIPNTVTKIDNFAFNNCKKLSSVVLKNKKKAPKISERTFAGTKSGIKFYVKNKRVAKSLKKNLKDSGVKNAKIYIGKTLVYSRIN